MITRFPDYDVNMGIAMYEVLSKSVDAEFSDSFD
jgi:hypothetical protein